MMNLQTQYNGSTIPDQAIATARQQAQNQANVWLNNQKQRAAQAQAQAQAQAHAHTRQQMMANLAHMPNGGMNGMGGMQ